MKVVSRFLALIATVFLANIAFADYPRPWQIGFQEAVTPVMRQLAEFHDFMLIIIYAISALVFLLLAYVCLRFNAKANPVPSKTTHNTMIEIIWTVVPIIILVVIAIPSMRTLYYAEKVENADMTLKVIGNQWYWTYQYPDNGNFIFDSNMIEDDELPKDGLRLLEVDNRVVVPVNTTVRVLITAADVIHNWAIPAFGIKMDAVPGRTNETWFRAEKTGVYYGQCSELCGVKHAFMPIAVEVVSQQKFEQWVEKAKADYL